MFLILAAAVFTAPAALAQANGSATASGTGPAGTTDLPGSPGGWGPEPKDDRELEAQLDAARHQLEESAQRVAELSARIGGPIIQRFSMLTEEPGGAFLGVHIDFSSGKDGVRVLDVTPEGPAAGAGIRAGDLITGVNGTDVTGDDSVHRLLGSIRGIKPDSKVQVRVMRAGKRRQFTVTARGRPPMMAFGAAPLAARMPALGPFPMGPSILVQGPLADLELATLTPKLGRYFGTDKGVLVVRAPAGAGLELEDGDVILSIDGREPTSAAHATRILASYDPGEKVTFEIMRDHRAETLRASLPNDRRGPHGVVTLRTRPLGAAPLPGPVVAAPRGGETL